MKAIFHSRKTKTALLIVNNFDKFTVGTEAVYVPLSAVEGLEPGDELTIPEGYKIVEWQTVYSEKLQQDITLKRLVRS